MGKRELSGTEKRTIQQTRGNGVQHLQWARNSACSHQPDWKTSYSWDFKKSTWKGLISVVREVIPRLLLLLLRHSVVSDFVRPQRRQPTRLRCPWDSPGKNTVVGCHFLLQCMKLKSEREVAWSCPTHSDPMDCSPLDFSIHGIFQARVLEWGTIAFSNS